eukprot:2918719-Karenia_brevis.AAC.1
MTNQAINAMAQEAVAAAVDNLGLLSSCVPPAYDWHAAPVHSTLEDSLGGLAGPHPRHARC